MDPWKNKQRNVYESLNNPENFTPEQIQQQQKAALWAAAQSKIQQQNFSEFYQNCPPPHPFSTEPVSLKSSLVSLGNVHKMLK